MYIVYTNIKKSSYIYIYIQNQLNKNGLIWCRYTVMKAERGLLLNAACGKINLTFILFIVCCMVWVC